MPLAKYSHNKYFSVIKRHKHPHRKKLLKSLAFGAVGVSALTLVEALALEPEWIQINEMDLPIKNLPPAFIGKRIIHISDLHCSRVVRVEYLQRCMNRVNQLRPDLVVMTGDYITYNGWGRYTQKAINLMGWIRSREGVFACLGNHDYGVIRGLRPVRKTLMRELTRGMEEKGIKVLRNQSCVVSIDGQRIWLVGLGDLWGDDFEPERAFSGVPEDEPVLVLAHNPDSIDYLQDFAADVVMSGHTHGGQVRVPFMRPPLLPIKNKQYHAGMFEVGGKKLYVNRGLGRLGRFRFNCRPEIAVFTLTR